MDQLFSAEPVTWPKPGDSVFCAINVEQVRAKALEYIDAPRVVLDVEGDSAKNDDGSWKNPCLAQYLLDAKVDKEAAIDLYLEILAIWKAANPDTRVGYYGIFKNSFWFALKEQGYKWKWLPTQESYTVAQQSLSRLTGAVDDLYPAAYWDGTFPSAYARAAELMEETAQLLHPDKPVYPFIWYRTGVDGPAHQAATFQFVLETMQSHANGVVLWAHSRDRGTNDRKPINFIIPENGKPMGWQARWMQNSRWQSTYKESQWMYVLRDFKEGLD